MDALAILKGVREVAALASPDEPMATTQRAFDSKREHDPKHAELPPARKITEQLRLPWHEVLLLAHEPEDRQAQLIGIKTRAEPANWLTREHAAAVLRICAARRDSESLTSGEYRRERNTILAENRRFSHRGALPFPTDEQLVTFAGSWEEALRLAGLATTAPRREATRQVALPRVAVIERFHEHYGKRPSRPELEAFARGNGIPMRAERGRKWSVIVAEWESLRREQGLPPARVAPRPPGRPTPKRPRTRTRHYERDIGAARPGEEPIMGKWTREKCAAAVARYLAQLPSGARSTERGYSDWAASQPRGTAPAMSTILALGGWEGTRRDALRARRT